MSEKVKSDGHGDGCRCEACCGARYAERNKKRLYNLNIRDEDWRGKPAQGAQRHSASTGDWAEYLDDY